MCITLVVSGTTVSCAGQELASLSQHMSNVPGGCDPPYFYPEEWDEP